ncbi:MAG: family 16 glycosylhydrolase [Chloroflexota bacterium]
MVTNKVRISWRISLCLGLWFGCLLLLMSCRIPEPADWDEYPVPVDPGLGNEWKLLPLSDDFNYSAPPENKGNKFAERWIDRYHNPWLGPGLTEWRTDHSWVADGNLVLDASRNPNTDTVYTGIISSKETVIYPLYVEARAKISNMVLANSVWLLSPDDTQEIDIVESYGSDRKGQEWFARRVHLSHHVFIREPFQDYQPKDMGSWYNNGTTWRDDFHRFGVFWRDTWHLEYYVDGELVRTVSGKSIIDPNGFTSGTGLNKAMDVIIDVEDQDWRSNDGLTPTDEELADEERKQYHVDWIRFYQLVSNQ